MLTALLDVHSTRATSERPTASQQELAAPDLHVCLRSHLFLFPLNLCVRVCVCGHMHGGTCGHQRTAVGVGFSLPPMGPGELTRVVSLGGKHFYPRAVLPALLSALERHLTLTAASISL